MIAPTLRGPCFAIALAALTGWSSPGRAAPQPDAPRAGLAAHVGEASRRFGLPEAWIAAVIDVESAGDRQAVSRAGAMGLMQIMPATWAELRDRYGLGHDPFHPRDNILAGAAYLRELHDRYGAAGFLAAYNAGPGRYERSFTTGGPLPAETRAYVARLAPMLNVGPVDERLGRRLDPLGWTRSALFPDRSSDVLGAAQVGDDAQGERRRVARSDIPPSVPAPPSNSLFVPLSSGTPSQ